MKLRVLGNSIRLRVSKTELDQLAGNGEVADAIQFGLRERLSYCLCAGAEAAPSAAFADGVITVTVAASDVRELAGTERVSIAGEQLLADGSSLQILVEKDFECLVPRPGEDPRELFDNPAKS